jgi:hypothetical protein
MSKDIMLLRAPSFQDEQLMPQRNTSKLSYISKINDKYGLPSKEIQAHKIGFQD